MFMSLKMFSMESVSSSRMKFPKVAKEGAFSPSRRYMNRISVLQEFFGITSGAAGLVILGYEIFLGLCNPKQG